MAAAEDRRHELRDITIREIEAEDAERAASLSGELGYPLTPELMKQRIEGLRAEHNHVVFVACRAGEVVGWIDVGIINHLSSGTYTEIGGLIVADGMRSIGIGQELVARAEQWGREQGVSTVLVRSRATREAAHRFYLRQGFQQVKTSAVFSKSL